MIFRNCSKYGRTKTKCRQKGVCRICRENYHTSGKTNKCSNESKCANCEERHMEESNYCETEIKESVIRKMQANSRVGSLRALNILAGENES